jgi:lipopolysaccharide export system permease protein
MRDPASIEKKPKDMTIRELKTQIEKLKASGISPTPLLTEAHAKVSLAFSCLVFILLGSSLAIITRRKEKSINFSITFLIVGIYYLLFIGFEALSLQGVIAPQFAMWMPNLILGIIGVVLTFRLCAY